MPFDRHVGSHPEITNPLAWPAEMPEIGAPGIGAEQDWEERAC
jgi:hypothetical protein